LATTRTAGATSRGPSEGSAKAQSRGFAAKAADALSVCGSAVQARPPSKRSASAGPAAAAPPPSRPGRAAKEQPPSTRDASAIQQKAVSRRSEAQRRTCAASSAS
jgi:hypothetical protein